MRVHKDDGADHGEPPDSWTVVRRWRQVPATSAVEAIEMTQQFDHSEVSAFHDDLSPRLYDTPLTTIVLCRYTAAPRSTDVCEYREQRRHPDEHCWQLFYAVPDESTDDMTVPMAFTREENAALLTVTSASLQQIEQAEERAGLDRGRSWQILNSLRTLFAENGYAFERRH